MMYLCGTSNLCAMPQLLASMNELAGQIHRNRLACRAAWWKWHQTGLAVRLIPVDIARRTLAAARGRIRSAPKVDEERSEQPPNRLGRCSAPGPQRQITG